MLRIAPGEDAPSGPTLNWDAVDPSAFDTEQGRRQAAEQLTGDRSFDGHVILMNQRSCYGLRAANWRADVWHQMGSAPAHRDRKEPADKLFHSPGMLGLPGSPGFPANLLMQACCRAPEGLFSIVSQVSPTGGANFEDLTILDPTDPNQWLLVVIVPDGEDYVVYRRLYFGDK